jgi:pSer/pThr/pTyr-binding forkhead associated (FHA) protein
MMELEVAGQRTSIPHGELTIGADPSCGLRLAGIGAAHAVVSMATDGSCSVRRVGEHEVALNGVKLGAEPAPILHGDKLQMGGHEILVTDPRRSGSTQFVSAADVARMVSASVKPGGAKAATAATGGRMVCLTDGREYSIGTAPLVIGREAGCDIVVPNKDVSRRHAEIFASPQGYVLVDSSTNGTWVNGERVEAQRVLARADVIRIGDHEFRFYADRAPEPAPAPAPVAAPAPPAPAPRPAPPPAAASAPPPQAPVATPEAAPPVGASERLSQTMMGMPLTPPAGKPIIPPAASPPGSAQPSAPPPVATPGAAAPAAAARPSGASGAIATFLVRTGSLKGQRLTVRVPVVNIGRAEYNDLVIPDDSVSGSHAKLQRREGIWVLTDNESTNGTWVDGERVHGEVMLGPGAVVRFGEVSVLFEPTDDHLGTAAGSGTKVMGAIKVGATPPPAPAPAPPPTPAAKPKAPEPATAGPQPVVPRPAPPPEPVRTPPADRPVATPAPRRPVVVSSPPSSTGMPRWVVPLVLVIILGVAAAVLFLR